MWAVIILRRCTRRTHEIKNIFFYIYVGTLPTNDQRDPIARQVEEGRRRSDQQVILKLVCHIEINFLLPWTPLVDISNYPKLLNDHKKVE